MKKREVEKLLKSFGWYLLRHGSRHDIWTNSVDQVEVPRHPEINEKLARYAILKPAEQNKRKK